MEGANPCVCLAFGCFRSMNAKKCTKPALRRIEKAQIAIKLIANEKLFRPLRPGICGPAPGHDGWPASRSAGGQGNVSALRPDAP